MRSTRPMRSAAPLAPRATSDRTSEDDPLAWPQTFARRHAGEWCAVALLLVVPVATGADLWHQIGWDSDTGRLLFLALALVGMGAAAFYAAGRIAVRVTVAPRGIIAVRGPWRRELRWEEVARLLERTATVDRRPLRWLVAQAHDGRRVQVHEDLVADYARLRAVAIAAQQRWRALGGTAVDVSSEQSGAYGPLYLARELPGMAALFVAPALACAAVALYLWALLVPLRPLALALGVAALVLGAVGLRALLGRRSFAFDDGGVEAWSRLPAVRLDWHDLARVEHRRPWASQFIRLAGRMSDRLHALVAGRACWDGDAPWPRRAPEVLLLRGGGRHLALPLHRLRDPDAVVARIERGIQVARQTAHLPVAPTALSAHLATARSTARITTRLPAMPVPDGATPDGASDSPPDGDSLKLEADVSSSEGAGECSQGDNTRVG